MGVNQREGVAMMKKGVMAIAAFFLFSVFGFIQKAEAVPVFARVYRTSCATCHVPYPKLNSFGEAFKFNGYRIPGKDEAYVKEEPVALGAAAYKRVWPDAIWPGAIPQNVPVSFRVESQFTYSTEGTAKSNLEFPHEIEMLAAGAFGDLASFRLDYTLQDEDDKALVERMFLSFDDFLSWWGVPEDALNLKIGFFDIGAVPFPDQIRTTVEHSLVNSLRVSTSQVRFRDSQAAIEANGILHDRFHYALGIANGDPDTPGNTAVADENTDKDVYYRADYKFGGLPPSGRGGPEGLSDQGFFDISPSFLIGHSGYYGTDQVGTEDVEFTRFTGFGRLQWDRLNLEIAYLYGWDDRSNTLSSQAVVSNVYSIQADYLLYPWLLTSLRYDDLDRDAGVDNRKLIPNIQALIRANMKLVAEARLHPDGSKDGEETDRYVIRLDYVF